MSAIQPYREAPKGYEEELGKLDSPRGCFAKIHRFFFTDTSEVFICKEIGYIKTLKLYIEENNAEQLRIWQSEYSGYKSAQILFGKYFESMDMFKNYMKDEAPEKTPEEISIALKKLVDNRRRELAGMFHPDKHINTSFEKDLIKRCFQLIPKGDVE